MCDPIVRPSDTVTFEQLNRDARAIAAAITAVADNLPMSDEAKGRLYHQAHHLDSLAASIRSMEFAQKQVNNLAGMRVDQATAVIEKQRTHIVSLEATVDSLCEQSADLLKARHVLNRIAAEVGDANEQGLL